MPTIIKSPTVNSST
ncbi:MAG: hypothetical protein EZS28_049257, partial [Streblomastix strix]